MKISYAITVCNELKEIQTLLNFLKERVPKFSRKVDFKLPPPTSIKLPSNKIKIK